MLYFQWWIEVRQAGTWLQGLPLVSNPCICSVMLGSEMSLPMKKFGIRCVIGLQQVLCWLQSIRYSSGGKNLPKVDRLLMSDRPPEFSLFNMEVAWANGQSNGEGMAIVMKLFE